MKRGTGGEALLNDSRHRFAVAEAPAAAPQPYNLPRKREMALWPMPHMGLGDRVLFRALGALGLRHVRAVTGAEHILTGRDPFIIAPNHSTWGEAIFMPAVIFALRGGKRIHFLADWNFQIVPGIGLIFRRGQVITVTQKDSRPAFLNRLRPFFEDPVPPFERAKAHLLAGRPVGIFPEGRVNRDPKRLLVGRVGMARLSLETGVPVIPVGIRFPGAPLDRPTAENQAMEVHIGAPLDPPVSGPDPSASAVRAWHAAVMREISRLSGKAWGRRAADAADDDRGAVRDLLD